MATQYDTNFRLRACQRCNGDAYLDLMDEPEWRCLQCARSVPKYATAQVIVSASTLRAA